MAGDIGNHRARGSRPAQGSYQAQASGQAQGGGRVDGTPAGVRGGKTRMPFIAMYHSVEPYQQDPYLVTVSPRRFEQQLDWLSARGLRGVSVGELLTAPPGQARTMAGLTFDDGYADFLHHVLPALQRHGFGATLFAIAGRLGEENSWDAEGPRKPLMTAEQLRQAAEAGIEIGSHGLTHVSLPSVTDAALADETERSRRVLQEISGQEVAGFCYPYGDIDSRAFDYVRRAGYGYACAIWASSLTGRHALPRTYIGDADYSLRMRAKLIRHRLKWGGAGGTSSAAKTSRLRRNSRTGEPTVSHSA